jgi:flagellar hook-associated protein 3
MRVTNNMIANQVTSNLQRSLDRYMKLQTMMSTGKRINQPSDDPIGTQRDLGYRKVLTEIAQYKTNISSGLSLLSTYDTALGDMKDMVSSAYEIAVSLSNDTYDETARSSAASEVESLFEQMIDMANSQIEGCYIFSGYRTKTKPFVTSAYGVDYMGDDGQIETEIESSTKVGINLVGSNMLFKPFSILGGDADLKTGISATTLLSDLHLGEGVDLAAGTFIVEDNNLGISVTVDISTAVTVGDAITLINNQLAAGGITNLTADYGQEGNNLRWTTVDTGQITAVTLLSNLNNGSGVDLSTGKILISDASGSINVEVDLSSAANIGDVITGINDALTAAGVTNVSASINPAGTGINITDSNGTPLGLSVTEVSGSSTTAGNLGILGDINPVLSGEALNPELSFSVTESAAGETTATDLGLQGEFSEAKAGDGLSAMLLGTTELSLLNNGSGFDLGQIQISKGRKTAYLDLGSSAYTTVNDIIDAINNSGLDISVSINDAGTGIQIEPTNNNSSLIIREVGGGETAHDLGIFGSSDVLGSMMVLTEALQNDDREVTGQLIENLNLGMQDLLNSRAVVGAKVNRLETTDSRLTNLDYNFTTLLSETEDADLTQLVTDLSVQENSYNAALIAAAKIIQPSLLDFLD